MEIELSEKENSLQESLQKQTEMAKKLSNIYLMEFEQKKQNEKLLKVNQFRNQWENLLFFNITF